MLDRRRNGCRGNEGTGCGCDSFGGEGVGGGGDGDDGVGGEGDFGDDTGCKLDGVSGVGEGEEAFRGTHFACPKVKNMRGKRDRRRNVL